MRRPRGYLILVALALIFVLLVLALALFHSGSVAGGLVAMSHRRLVEDTLLESTLARLGILMEGRTPPGPRDLALDGRFAVGQDRYRARVTWREGTGSVRLPQPAGCATAEAVLPEIRKPGLPAVGYDPRLVKTAADSVPVAPGHAAVALDFSDSDRYVAVYSNAFPFAAYAPRGSIQVSRVGSFSNAGFREAREDPKVPVYTGVPVWLAARGTVTATSFPHGRAWSETGPMNVPGGAVALREAMPEDARAARLSRDAQAAFSALSSGTLDKTGALVGHVLTPQGMWKLLTGEGSLGDILSLQQATMVPFIPIPGISKVPPVFVLHLHHPWPPDLSRPDPGPGPRARLEKATKELAELFEQRQKLRGELQDLRDELRRIPPDDPRREQLEKDIKAKEKATQEAYKRWNEKNSEVEALARELREGTWESGRVLAGIPPEDAAQEGTYRTLGWSYFYVVEAAAELLVKLVETGDFQVLFDVLATPTRVVHLGGENPEFYFPDGLPRKSDTRDVRRPSTVPLGTLSTKGTLTVPRGRTLKLTPPLQVRGDLWIQRGASLAVQSSLEVTGRILLEEGASLLVGGDLRCTGGTPVTGSVTVAAPYDAVHPLTSAILCKGDVYLNKGVSPGVTMADLVGYARTENASFEPAYDFLWNYDWLAPQIAKVLGPFEARTCWFADYATTVVFVPIKGIPIPVPLPLPQSNCLKGLFDLLSPFYALQLNARLGPNLYPQSLLWIYGRDVVPIFPRSDPAKVADKLSGLVGNIPNLTVQVVLQLLPEFLKDTVGAVARTALTKVLVLAVNAILKNVLPFNPVPCSLTGGPDKQPTALRQVVNTILKTVGSKLLESFAAILIVTRDSLVGEIGKDPAALARETPGLFLYTEKSLHLGATKGDAPVAAGLFVARGDISCRAQRTFGALVSLEGSIRAEDLYYYPYFTWASLYNPLKPAQYPDLGPLTPNAEFRDMFFFEVPRGKAKALDVNWNGWRVLGRGWVAP